MKKLKLTGKIIGTILGVILIVSTFYVLFKAIFSGNEDWFVYYCIGLSATGSAMMISILSISIIEDLWKKPNLWKKPKKENKDEKRK